jgi:hypothetical protein
MARSDLLVALVVALIAAALLALGDNDLVASAAAVAACAAIVLAWFWGVRRYTGSSWPERLHNSSLLYLSVPLWALAFGAPLAFLTDWLDLDRTVQVATWAAGAATGAVVRIAEIRGRLGETVRPPRPSVSGDVAQSRTLALRVRLSDPRWHRSGMRELCPPLRRGSANFGPSVPAGGTHGTRFGTQSSRYTGATVLPKGGAIPEAVPLSLRRSGERDRPRAGPADRRRRRARPRSRIRGSASAL